jgi:hypothetical protein
VTKCSGLLVHQYATHETIAVPFVHCGNPRYVDDVGADTEYHSGTDSIRRVIVDGILLTQLRQFALTLSRS